LLSDDPATFADMQAWARMTGNTYKQLDSFQFLVTKSVIN
jgi:hypothetical protein